MSDEPFALSTIPPQPLAAEGDFDTICETVKASARGRWFLEEYARRNRNADTVEVLAAIGRVEGVVRDGRDREAYHSARADLLDMARTIAVTRAEVAESKVEAVAEVKPQSASESEPAAATSEVFAMAERIQDVAWTMRERGLDPRTCEQIETLARTILSAPSLRNPDDHRARKLGEVLHHLERRIEGMLDAVVAGAAGRQGAADAPDDAAADAPAEAVAETVAHEVLDEVQTDIADPPPPAQPMVAEPLDQPGSDDPIAVEAALEPEAALTVAADAPDGTSASDLPATTVAPVVAMPESLAIETLTIEPAISEPVISKPPIAVEPVDFLSEPLPPPLAPPPVEAVTNIETEPVAMAEGAVASEPPPVDDVPPAPPEPAPAPVVATAASEPVGAAPVLPIGQVSSPVVRQMPRPPSNDLLRALAAMTDAERIALFT
jgi:hypothetical protein